MVRAAHVLSKRLSGARLITPEEKNMTVATFEELTKYRWSSDNDADRFPVENPATGKVITVGGGAEQMNAAIDARQSPGERQHSLLACLLNFS